MKVFQVVTQNYEPGLRGFVQRLFRISPYPVPLGTFHAEDSEKAYRAADSECAKLRAKGVFDKVSVAGYEVRTEVENFVPVDWRET